MPETSLTILYRPVPTRPFYPIINIIKPDHLKLHNRRSIRLKGYDYASPGAYFITFCTYQHLPILGKLVDNEVHISEAGLIVLSIWKGLPLHYQNTGFDEIIIMPDHVHCVIFIKEPENPTSSFHGIPEIIRAFKSFSAREINRLRKSRGQPVWQRGYYDRIVRDDEELNKIRQYIRGNPYKS